MEALKRTALASTLLALVLTGCSEASDPVEPEAGDAPAATAGADVEETEAPAEDGMVTFSSLTGQATQLSLDDGVLSALSGLGVELTATGGATSETASGMTTFTFPVSGGQATVDASGGQPFTGNVEHEGGLQLSALGQSVTIDALVLDGAQEQLTAEVAGRRVPLLPLVTDPEVTVEQEQATVAWSAGSLDTSAMAPFADQLGLELPPLEINSLEATLEGS